MIFSIISVLVILFSTNAYATKAEFVFRQTALKYSETRVTSKPAAGGSNHVTTTKVEHFPSDLEIAIETDKYAIYLFPTEPGAALEFGYYPKDGIEVGFDLDISSTNSDTTETSTFGIGGFFEYKMDLGPGEIEFEVELGTKTEKTATTKTTTLVSALEIFYYLPIFDNVEYIFGAEYEIANGKVSETGDKTEERGLSIFLATIEIKI